MIFYNSRNIKILINRAYHTKQLHNIKLELKIKVLHGVVANMWDCEIVIRKFELQLRYYVHFRTNTLGESYEPLLPLTPTTNNTINSITIVLLQR